MKKKDQNFIKKENQNLILDLIQDHDLVTRAKLARLASMSPTTVSRIVASLMDVGLVKETNKHTTGVGRKATFLSLNPDSLVSIGVELDEKNIRVGFFDFLGRSIATEETEKELREDASSVVSRLKEIIFRLIHQYEIDIHKITGICVGLPGLVNNETGEVIISAQLGWENESFGQLLKDELNYPVLIDNELKLKAYAEKLFSKDKSSDTMVVLGFGSGVGSALIMGDTIYRGYLNSAGEIGHTVVDPNGMLCTCGNFGCLQTYIAEGFLIREASKQADVQDLEDIILAADENQKWAVNIIERAITYAAITINNSVCLNNPDKIILTGSTIERFPSVRDSILEAANKQIWSPLSDTTTIEVSALGDTGVILGAGLLSQRVYINQLNDEKELIKNE